ncbi:recombinase family protein [Thaumasiovibrio subtropicus]|uniref:recombinase family protein n=1 Tax=Thaumasiovibrio subtropicus TaxID=1891207 RepID=UPI00131ADDB5|nr:recombinase family protein [Thaumasiovibrio subtropicus]
MSTVANYVGYVRRSPMNHALEAHIEEIRHQYPTVEIEFERGVRGNVIAAERPVLKPLLDRLSAGDCLIVWWIDCLGGHGEDLLNNLNVLLARGVEVRTIHHDIVLKADDPSTVAQLALLAGMASFERKRRLGFAEAGREALRQRPQEWQRRFRGRRPDTARHHRIAALLLSGCTLHATAEEAGASVSTVKRVKAKLVADGKMGEMRGRGEPNTILPVTEQEQ